MKATAERVCVVPIELLMQQAKLRFAAHVERHNYMDEPFLPRVVAHSVIAIPGQEPWLTRNGSIQRTVTHPSGYRKINIICIFVPYTAATIRMGSKRPMSCSHHRVSELRY